MRLATYLLLSCSCLSLSGESSWGQAPDAAAPARRLNDGGWSAVPSARDRSAGTAPVRSATFWSSTMLEPTRVERPATASAEPPPPRLLDASQPRELRVEPVQVDSYSGYETRSVQAPSVTLPPLPPAPPLSSSEQGARLLSPGVTPADQPPRLPADSARESYPNAAPQTTVTPLPPSSSPAYTSPSYPTYSPGYATAAPGYSTFYAPAAGCAAPAAAATPVLRPGIVAAPTTVYSPANARFAPGARGATLGPGMEVRGGLLGQPVLRVEGQPLRNFLRWVTP